MNKEQFLKENIGVSIFCQGGEIWQGDYSDISRGIVINEQPPGSGNYTLAGGGIVLVRFKETILEK
jgi:hypothetical protein